MVEDDEGSRGGYCPPIMKLQCEDCGWKGTHEDALKAPHPFLPEDEIQGCPQCFEVSTLRNCCDEEGCWDLVQAGTPSPNGYRLTCSKHVPK